MPTFLSPIPFTLRPPADLLTRAPHLRRLSSDLALKHAAGQRVTEADLRAVGSALWQALGVDEAFAAARRAAGNAVLPLILETADPALQALPWETLYHPEHGFLGRDPAFTLSRRLGDPPLLPEPTPGPLRVLHFTALPEDVDPEHVRLDLEAEREAIQEVLLPWLAKGCLWLETPDDGSWETFRALLRDFSPHLVFLSGHGRFVHQPHSGETRAEFLFEDEDGRSLPVRAAALAEAFVGLPVQAVVLSACESGKSASDALASGLAQTLAARGLPHVVGMRETLLDAAGIQFARAFFALRCPPAARRGRRPSRQRAPGRGTATRPRRHHPPPA